MRGRQERDDLSRQLAETQAQVAQLEARLRETAERDPVTGLLSLSRFRATLDIEADRARRCGGTLTLAVRSTSTAFGR